MASPTARVVLFVLFAFAWLSTEVHGQFQVVGWGEDTAGSLGAQEPLHYSVAPIFTLQYPAELTRSGKLKIETGSSHGVAINNGTVYVWGKAGEEALVYDHEDLPFPTAIDFSVSPFSDSTFIDIFTSNNNSFMIASDGRVATWGQSGLLKGNLPNKRTGQPASETEIGELALSSYANFIPTHIGCGMYSCHILNKSGELYGWGDNSDFQLGIDTEFGSTSIPQPVNISSQCVISLFSSGDKWTIAKCTNSSDGSSYMVGWGVADVGQLGHSEPVVLPYPVRLPTFDSIAPEVTQISCTATSVLLVLDDRILVTIGDNQYGQLGVNSQESNSSQIQYLSMSSFFELSEIGNISMIRSAASTHYVLTSTGRVFAFGLGGPRLMLGDGGILQYSDVPIQVNTSHLGDYKFISISTSITANRVFGIVTRNSWAAPKLTNFTTPSAIPYYDGQQQIVGFGDGIDGAFGLGYFSGLTPPVVVGAGRFLLKNESIVDFSTVGYHTVALTDKSNIYTWGSSGSLYPERNFVYGVAQDYPNSNFPVRFMGLGTEFENDPSVKVFAAPQTSFCITQSGRLFSWGLSPEGLLGTGAGPGERSLEALEITPPNELVVTMDCASDSQDPFCALVTTNGTVMTWGRVGSARTGRHPSFEGDGWTPQYVNNSAFSQMSGKHIISVSVSDNHVLALSQDGRVYGWGSVEEGRLGLAEPSLQYPSPYSDFETDVPIEYPIFDYLSEGDYVVKVLANFVGSVLLTNTGDVYCSGSCSPLESSLTPASISLVVSFEAFDGKIVDVGISSPSAFIFLTDQGSIYTMGTNTQGMLGRDYDLNDGSLQMPAKVQLPLGSIPVVSNSRIIATPRRSSSVYDYSVAANGFFMILSKHQTQNSEPNPITRPPQSRVAVWGSNTLGEAGNGRISPVTRPQLALAIEYTFQRSSSRTDNIGGIDTLDAGSQTGHILTTNGRVMTFGKPIGTTVPQFSFSVASSFGFPNYNQYFDNQPIEVPQRVVPPTTTIEYYASTEILSFAINANGELLVSQNYEQQVNKRTSKSRRDTLSRQLGPSDDLSISGGPFSNVKQMKCGIYVCGILFESGELHTWSTRGPNSAGEIGRTDDPLVVSPILDPDPENLYPGQTNVASPIVQFSFGRYNSLILRQDGYLLEFGSLIDQEPTNLLESATPKPIPDFNIPYPHTIISIATGVAHNLILVRDTRSTSLNRVFGWGETARGQLGKVTELFLSFEEITFDNHRLSQGNFVQVAASKFTSFALTDKGDVYSWGSNGAMDAGGAVGILGRSWNQFTSAVPGLVQLRQAGSNSVPLNQRIKYLVAKPTSDTIYAVTQLSTESGCLGTAPSSNFSCVRGQWTYDGSLTYGDWTGSSGIVWDLEASGPVYISGDLVLLPGATVLFGFPEFSEYGPENPPLISVGGCASISGSLSMALSKSNLKTLADKPSARTIDLIKSSCLGSTDRSGRVLAFEQPPLTLKSASSCNKATARTNTRSTTGTDGEPVPTLQAVFTMDSSRCNRWWIAVVATLVPVLIIVTILTIVIYKRHNRKMSK